MRQWVRLVVMKESGRLEGSSGGRSRESVFNSGLTSLQRGVAGILLLSLHPPKIGRYSVIRRLGKGGFGEVFLALDEELDRPVAIKVPRPERVSCPEDVAAYLTEARIVASLDHPHIVPVYDVGRTEDGLCFVVSKFIEGSDLAARIKEARFSFQESAGLVATVAESCFITHILMAWSTATIKPANILIETSGKAYVADFGLALDWKRTSGSAAGWLEPLRT